MRKSKIFFVQPDPSSSNPRKSKFNLGYIQSGFYLNLFKCLVFLIMAIGASSNLYGQIPSAIVEFEGKTGILIPRVTTAERDAIVDPKDGQLIYNMTDDRFYYFSDITDTWRRVSIDGDTPPGSTGTGEIPHQPSLGADWNVRGNEGADVFSSDPPLLGNTDYKPIVFITDDLERLRITEDGIVKIAGDLEVGEDLTVKQNVFLNTEGGSTSINGPTTVGGPAMNPATFTGPVQMDKTLNVDGATTLNNTLDVDGVTTLNNDLFVTGMSSTQLTGTLDVDKTLNVDGATTLQSNLDVNNMAPTHLTGTLDVDKTLNVDGATTLQSNLDVNNMAPTHLTGTLDVDKAFTVGTGSTAMLKFDPAKNLTSEDAFANYPLQITGAKQGMAIEVNAWQPDRNFIAFFSKGKDGTGAVEMRGRIEPNNNFLVNDFQMLAENLADPDMASESPDGSVQADDDTTFNAQAGVDANSMTMLPASGQTYSEINGEQLAEFIVLCVELIGAAITLGTSFTSIFDPLDIFEAALALAISAANLGMYIGFTLANLGIAYESGSGDYAEWLPRADTTEILHFGDVVGVIGGEVSKEYILADKFMVVSAAPAVLGNMPQTRHESKFEKIAFMGQVPVKVRGTVHIGDYILPSSDGDGLAIAVHPDKMKVKDFQRIVGIAWEDSKKENEKDLYQMINTAVGINQNDLARVIDQMQLVMNQMQEAIKEVNPAYEGFVFDTDSGVNGVNLSPDFTVSASHRSKIEEYFADKTYETQEELGQLVLDALVDVAGVNLTEIPVLENMLTNPEYAQKAQDYYAQKLVEYKNWMEQLKRNN
ncbi:MAG: hypothetical protein KDC80_07375 [Saprospiraceae bacterium]|nr:hypothetical protein [Saprospiraceae bacterium]